MRKRFFTLVLIVTLLSACTPATEPTATPTATQTPPTETATPAPTLTATSTQPPPTVTPDFLAPTPPPALVWPYNLLDVYDEPSVISQITTAVELYRLLSPDGQWLVDHFSLSGQPSTMRVTATEDPTITISGTPDHTVYTGTLVISWSPDSSAIAVEGTDKPAERYFDRVTVYQLTDQGEMTQNTYYLPDGEKNPVDVAWSPDSSKLALSHVRDKVTIIDRQAQFIQSMSIPDRGQVFWTESGLFVSVTHHYEGYKAYTELRQYDLASPDQYQVVIARDEWFLVMGFDAETRQVLIANLIDPPEDRHYRLEVYDLTSGENQVVATLPGDIEFRYLSYVLYDQIAFVLDSRTDSSQKLMLFDWSNLGVYSCGEAMSLVGWRPNTGGIVVVQGNEPPYWIEVISPTGDDRCSSP